MEKEISKERSWCAFACNISSASRNKGYWHIASAGIIAIYNVLLDDQ
jgi:hypothetical protein